MTKFKYSLIGSHGTGKSSAATYLTYLLKKEYRDKSVVLIEENVREIYKLMNGRINTTSFQKLLIVQQITNELTKEELYDIVVTDRTAIDFIVYAICHKVKLPTEYVSLAINHLDTFDRIFFIRPDSYDSEITNDGFRDTDLEIRKEVDIEFERLLYLWGKDFTEIRTSNIFNYDYLENL